MFMGIKERRGNSLNSELLKLGLSLALSLGGIVFTLLRFRRVNLSPPAALPPGEIDSEVAKDDLHAEEDSCPKAPCDLSSSTNDSFLLPEFDLLVKEYSVEDDVPCRVNYSCVDPVTESSDSVVDEFSIESEDEEKIRSLENKVKFLEERVRILEMQLIEFYGFKEQEEVIKGLEDRIRVHNSEADVYRFKIESLQEHNRILEGKVADHTRVLMELEEAKAMLKLLRRKLRSEAEQNREHILNLQERVMKMRDDTKPEETREIEELEEMRKVNENLKNENSELSLKLEKLQILATSALDNRQVEELERENLQLVQHNRELNEEIEQLQTDRCADVEELVYLRWVNACLRYELRNYQPGPGEQTAKDLGRTLSPKSEENAKRLIQEYAMREGSGEKTMSFDDFDFSQWPTDALYSAELLAGKSDSTRKSTVLTRLMNIWREKHKKPHDQAQADYIIEPAETITLKLPGTSSFPSLRSSFDLHGSDSGYRMSMTSGESSPHSRRRSEDYDLSIFRKIDTIGGRNKRLSTDTVSDEDSKDSVKAELVKYAEALEISLPKPAIHRRSAQFCSF